MEQILVSLDIREAAAAATAASKKSYTDGFWRAAYRAVLLATRIKANVHVLLVSDNSDPPPHRDIFAGVGESVRRRLDHMIEKGRSEGVNVNYYVAQGDYEEEVIRFVQENRVTLLVLGFPDGSDSLAAVREFEKALRRIRQGVSCFIELVQPKESAITAEKKISGGQASNPAYSDSHKHRFLEE